ncbi:extensin family protein [Bradyrhizobium sp. Tv2a-2]|uniref:extensin family protein n=1 Tax=Bradyrhizobium sp. Tv2a-2 TaxID=113395 RepID=UPI00046503F7|nr:extensin family protein [Bradyrhizobium sp. Tv2a-2]
MNFSARQGAGKWRFGAAGPGGAALVTAATVLCLFSARPEAAQGRRHADFSLENLFGRPPRPHRAARAAKVPLPLPRPPEAPREETEEAKGEPEIVPNIEAPAKPAAPAEQVVPGTPAPSVAPAAPQVSACRQALTEDIAIAPSLPSVHGPGGCGGDDLVRLEAIVLPDKHRVAVSPPATLRCQMAASIADWVRSDVAPLTERLGSEIASLDNFDSFECRGRNRIKGAPLSEHGKANALDVRAFKLADGRSIGLTDRSQPRNLREDVLHNVCARFMTVLGPDSDGYHEDHIHLDQMERRNNYKICQWDVLDPLPSVAPLMPAERPTDAPPREVAKHEGAKGDTAAEEGDKVEEAKPAEAQSAEKEQPASRPRRSAKLKH